MNKGGGLVQYGGQELCSNYQLREYLKVHWCWEKMVINLSCAVSHRFGNIFCHGCWGRNDQEDRPLTTHLATWRWIQGGKCHKQGRVLSPDCRKCGHSVPEIAGGALKCTRERCKFFICQYHAYSCLSNSKNRLYSWRIGEYVIFQGSSFQGTWSSTIWRILWFEAWIWLKFCPRWCSRQDWSVWLSTRYR